MKLKLKKLANPIMLVSDNPALPGGLSRMCRDLAMLCTTMPEFRVAVLGRGIGQKLSFPFITYDYPESSQWGEGYIQEAWEDFSRGEHGVIITLDDASRRHWFVNPAGQTEEMQKFCGPNRNYSRWMYLPLDSIGPDGLRLPIAALDCVSRFDRVAAASQWGYHALRNSGIKDADWLPHGYMTPFGDVVPKAKEMLGWDGKIVVGCVMANQSRKNFPAAFECFAHLKRIYGNRFQAWLHTNVMINHWNVYALTGEYGLSDHIEVSLRCNDSQLQLRYSGCDCTILPTQGEGFGFPIIESLAAGVSCVTTAYAGGSELVPDVCRVTPLMYQVDGPYNCLRAMVAGGPFAKLAEEQIELRLQDPEYHSGRLHHSVEHLNWDKLKQVWMRWLRDGLRGIQC